MEEKTKSKRIEKVSTLLDFYWKNQLEIGQILQKKNAINNLFECSVQGDEKFNELLKKKLISKDTELPVRISILLNLYELEDRNERDIVNEFLDAIIFLQNNENNKDINRLSYFLLYKIYENRKDENIFKILKEKYNSIIPEEIEKEIIEKKKEIIEKKKEIDSREEELKKKEDKIKESWEEVFIKEGNAKRYFKFSLFAAITSMTLTLTSSFLTYKVIKAWREASILNEKIYQTARELKIAQAGLGEVYGELRRQPEEVNEKINEIFREIQEINKNLGANLEKQNEKIASLDNSMKELNSKVESSISSLSEFKKIFNKNEEEEKERGAKKSYLDELKDKFKNLFK